ncbi:neutral alpha-glucosidase AB-like isoform X2 [Mytilus edulis]
MQQILVTLILLIQSSVAVNRDNFKTCQQSGFCKRHRAMTPGQSAYEVITETVNVQSTSVNLQLLNTVTNVKLTLELSGLERSTARIKINEVEPIKQRYEIPIGDVLVEEPKRQGLKKLEQTSQSLTLGIEKNKIVISFKPFRIDFYTEDEPVVSINAQGLLKFEHYRHKQGWLNKAGSSIFSWFSAPFREAQPEENVEEAKEGEELKEGDENAEEKPAEEEQKKDEEEPDLWEETFKSFTDSKPHGPSSVGLDVSFPGFENVYGIPEHADDFALKTTKDTDPYRLFNLDVFEYELYNPMALYGAVPVMMAHNEKNTVGIFWHNAAETWIDIKSNVADKNFFSKVADFFKQDSDIPQTDTHWFSESGVIDLFVMLGPKPKDVFKQYAVLTGTTPVPPLFSIAYHQCRWNYNDQDDVRNVDANMDKFDIPFDVIWLDIEHTDGKRYFTWDGNKFSHSVDMINNVASKGRKMVTIVDPHLKKDDNYKVYADAKSKDLLVKNKDGNEYDGWCWPGSSAWPDFTDPEVRKWWESKFLLSEYEGSTNDLHTWNDMNEPSVFNGPEISFHRDAKHHHGWENRDVHNIYGHLVQQATADGLILRSDHKERPFVLTRSFFAGSQRNGAVWTGDNIGEWSHLKVSNPMLLSLNLVGITFAGADVGGFFKNPDPELLTRWWQAGAFQPFFRSHAHIDTKRREPYLLPDNNMKIVRNAIRARYTFLPYWYTVFYNTYKNGGPVMQPLWAEYPEDKSTFKMDDQFLIGPSLLVKPITEQGGTGTNVYFPGANDVWYDILTAEKYLGGKSIYVNAPLEKIPVFQRGGSVIPRKMRVRRSSGLMHDDPITLFICLDRQGKASGDMYADDYHTFQYQNGKYLHRQFTFSNNKLTNSNADKNGVFETKEWIERILILGVLKKPNGVAIKIGNQQQQLAFGYDPNTSLLAIKKPGTKLQEDFVITLL